MKAFTDKVAAITGAGSGIGRALAVQLAGEGAHLAISDCNQTALDETADMLKSFAVNVSAHVLDVSDREAMAAFAAEVDTFHGGCDVIINNAGISYIETVDKMTFEDMERVINVNFWGVVNGVKSFMPLLKKSDEAHIVNVSSVFGLMSVPTQSTYNASKAAVRAFSEALTMELEKTRIGVSTVLPGGVRTNIIRNVPRGSRDDERVNADIEKFDRNVKQTPEAAAKTIIDGIRRGKKRIMIGKDAVLASWLLRLFPEGYMSFISRQFSTKNH